MPNGLIPRKRNRDFFQQFLPPEQQEDEGLFGLRRYQPLPEFETPRRNFWTSEGNLPAASDYQPSPGGYASLVRAPGMRQPEPRAPAPVRAYGEEFRQTHARPEREDKKYLAPAPGIGRRIAGVAAAFLGGLQNPQYGMEVGQQIIGGRQVVCRRLFDHRGLTVPCVTRWGSCGPWMTDNSFRRRPRPW